MGEEGDLVFLKGKRGRVDIRGQSAVSIVEPMAVFHEYINQDSSFFECREYEVQTRTWVFK